MPWVVIMMLDKYLARELGCPTGVLSSFVLPRLWNKRNVALNELVLDKLWLTDDDRVLEVGFGGGYLLGRLSLLVRLGYVAGIDVSPAMVAHCRKKYREKLASGKLDIRCSSAEAIPFDGTAFAKVCSVNSLFFWPDPERALREIARVTVPGGKLLLGFTSLESLRKRGFAKHGLNLFSDGELTELMRGAGYEDVTIERSADEDRKFGTASGIKTRA